MMNEKDSLGFMEDMSLILARRRAADEQIRSANERSLVLEQDIAMKTMEGVATFIGLKERDNRISELRDDRNKQVVHADALLRTLEHVVRDFAKSAGVSEVKLMERYNVVRTQHYNMRVQEGMEKGWFKEDPRLTHSDRTKKWYVPGLDADHGF
jgi:hypothetical protein